MKNKTTGAPVRRSSHENGTKDKMKNKKHPRSEGKSREGTAVASGDAKSKLLKKQERKAKRQKNAHVIQEATNLWETLRQNATSKDKKKQLVKQIIDLCDDRVPELAASHTASRIIQACVKHGAEDDRAKIRALCMPKIVELSKNPYARFVISKLITACGQKDDMNEFVRAFKGRAPELLRHPAGTHVLDDLYCAANLQQRRMMAAEFYGKEYALFDSGTLNNTKGPPDTLEDLLEAVDSQKRLSIIKYVASSIIPVIEKGLVDNQLAHKLIMEYLKSCPSSLIEDAVDTLSGEPLMHMIHTHEGAEAACMVLAYGSAKDRKKVLRVLKNHIAAALRDEWGFLLVATALTVTDDTALLRKSITTELEENIKEYLKDKHAHKVILQLLHPYSPRYFSPIIQSILKPQVKMIDRKIGEEGSEETVKVQLGLSKKDDNLRRKELLESGLGKAMLDGCIGDIADYLGKQYSSDIIVEMCCGGSELILKTACGEDAILSLHDAVISFVSTSDTLTDYYTSRALRRIILHSSTDEGALASEFTKKLWKKVLKGKCKELKDTHAAKVVAALVHSGCKEVSSGLEKEIKGSKKWAQQFLKKN